MKFLPFVLITEAGMTVFLSYIILFTYDRRNFMSFKQRAVVSIILVMMGGMLDSLTYYLLSDQSFLSTIVAFNISMITMSVTLLILLWRYTTDNKSRKLNRLSIVTFSLLLVLNEISMGVLVYALGFGYNSILGAMPFLSALVYIFSLGINGYLFIVPMIVEMSVFFFLRPAKGTHRLILISLLLTSIVSPTIMGGYTFTQPGSLLILGAMVIFVPILFERAIRENQSRHIHSHGNFLGIFPIYLLMMAGVLFGSLYIEPFAVAWSIYAISMVSGMAFYFVYSLIAGTSEITEEETLFKAEHIDPLN